MTELSAFLIFLIDDWRVRIDTAQDSYMYPQRQHYAPGGGLEVVTLEGYTQWKHFTCMFARGTVQADSVDSPSSDACY